MAYLGRRGALAPVTSADIPDNSITAAKIVADTIAAGDIADDAVGTAELANDVVINTSGAIAGTGGLTIDGATVFNEASADVDFRVEGNGNENMLVVDASADRIGIGTNAPSETVEMAGGFMKLTGAEGGSTGLIMWADEGDDAADKWRIIAKSAGGLDFGYGASYTAALSIDSSGNVGIGCTNPNVASFQSGSRVLSIEGDGADDFGVIELRSTDTTSANRIGEIRFVNKDATTSYVGQAGIRAFRDGADDATALGFYTEVTGGSMTERMRIDSDGNVTKPNNPAFYSYLSASAPTGTSASTTVAFDSTMFNIGSHFNTGTSQFTAPVDGVYYFNLNVSLNGVNDSSYYFGFYFQTSNEGLHAWMWIWENSKAHDYWADSMGRMFYMDAGDTCHVQLSGSGTGQFSAMRNGSSNTAFMGYLVG